MKRLSRESTERQSTLLPENSDDQVEYTKPVQLVDVVVDELDLGQQGFEGASRRK